MEKEFSPEERLLKLIRKRKKDGENPGQTEQGRKTGESGEGHGTVKKTSFLGSVLGKDRKKTESGHENVWLRYWRMVFKQTAKSWKNVSYMFAGGLSGGRWLGASQRIFVLLILVLLFYLVWDLTLTKSPSAKIVDIKKTLEAERAGISGKDITEERPVTYYLEAVGGRNIFQPFHSKEFPQTEVKKKKVQEVMANLNLLGTVTGRNPEVLIEDKKLRQTFVLKVGETFGDVTVVDIGDSRVVLDYEGETFELRL